MSAKVKDCLSLKELLKPTGYECKTSLRACCAMSGKLFCWKHPTDLDVVYTFSDHPRQGDIYLIGKGSGKIVGDVITENDTIEEESITLDGSGTYNRTADMDLELS